MRKDGKQGIILEDILSFRIVEREMVNFHGYLSSVNAILASTSRWQAVAFLGESFQGRKGGLTVLPCMLKCQSF
jgi:hypothetical protein